MKGLSPKTPTTKKERDRQRLTTTYLNYVLVTSSLGIFMKRFSVREIRTATCHNIVSVKYIILMKEKVEGNGYFPNVFYSLFYDVKERNHGAVNISIAEKQGLTR